ncbi:ATPase P [Candidatus Viridilinea mediisalina]|uniref:ATPase P n=1 Tax=Candidatus Viridilinea mediisalina TaxID=2024553 RepID=A0A2A6RMY2_9CHLR|nr:ATPase P [Candidatus Viridilinea mediisalina]
MQTLELRVVGMDCAECAHHVQTALAALPGVAEVQVLLAAEKALVRLDPQSVDRQTLAQAVEAAGYHVPTDATQHAPNAPPHHGPNVANQVLTLFGLVFGAVLLVVVLGEWLGLFAALTAQVPFWLGAALVILAGWSLFANVLRAARRGQVLAHTLMSLGALAALVVGEWPTAAVVVFFMRIGEYAEQFTAARARRAVRNLTALAPQQARIEREGTTFMLPLHEVQPGDLVIVRPGEQIPVDGEVLTGQATVNQAAITGESMPIEAMPGTPVFAASIIQFGSLRLRATRIGADSTFGKVIRLVEEAETHRAEVQRLADRFSAWYLPVVILVALLTFILRGDALATAAVLVVACSCAFALATPIAMLASIGAAAKHGLMIKGGKYIEQLARADLLLVDKTGTLTLGRPQLTDVLPLATWSSDELLALAAAAEEGSEHPLAEAVRHAAHARGLQVPEAAHFSAIPGQGVRAIVSGQQIAVGNARMLQRLPPEIGNELATQGKSLLYVTIDGQLAGLLAAADTLRPEVAAALERARGLGIKRIEMLTGDNAAVAATLANELTIDYRADLLPEDKIAAVQAYQAEGYTVVMVGDGVNDAPALAQADIGIAMGAAGSDIALEAAHITLMRDDWRLVPQALAIAQRTMGVIRLNLGFTAAYNLIGLSLAASGILPPMLAAAAQSLPDLGILANSSRLLKWREERGWYNGP